MSNGTQDTSDAVFRARLGSHLVIGSSIGVVVLAIVVVGAAAFKGDATGVKDSAQLIFTAVLPLLGTWVGTVLAFYYSKENFESARQGTLDLVRSISQRLSSTSVGEKMMPVGAIVKVAIPDGKSIEDLSLKDINDLFDKAGANGQKISRLMIVDSKGACVAMLHRSIWMEMLNTGAKEAQPVNVAADTLAKVLPLKYESRVGSTFKDFITKTIAHVAQDRTVADAKAAMEAKPHCQDVIITGTGKENEPVQGWISNVDISRLSEA